MGKVILQCCDNSKQIEAITNYIYLFLNQARTLNKRLIAKGFNQELHEFFWWENKEAQRIFNVHQKSLSYDCLRLNDSILTISEAYLGKYKYNKLLNYKLDFQDQISMVRNLLKNKHVSDWVKYKLDGGIEHILLDEAQDTSETQWEIIDTLMSLLLMKALRKIVKIQGLCLLWGMRNNLFILFKELSQKFF